MRDFQTGFDPVVLCDPIKGPVSTLFSKDNSKSEFKKLMSIVSYPYPFPLHLFDAVDLCHKIYDPNRDFSNLRSIASRFTLFSSPHA